LNLSIEELAGTFVDAAVAIDGLLLDGNRSGARRVECLLHAIFAELSRRGVAGQTALDALKEHPEKAVRNSAITFSPASHYCAAHGGGTKRVSELR